MLNQVSPLPIRPSILPNSSARTDESLVLEREFRRYYLERLLPFARAGIGLGLALVISVSVLDLFLAPRAYLSEVLPLRFVTMIMPLSLALGATFVQKFRRWLPQLFVGVALLVGIATVWIDVSAGRPGAQSILWGVVFTTLIAYLLLGLLLRQSVAVGWPLFLIYAGVAVFVEVPWGTMGYGVLFLGFSNLVGTYASFLLERDARELFANKRELTRLASTDGLTGLFNRHAFDLHLRRLWKQARREYEHIAVVVADIDHFKLYNDCYGHKMGDDCIKAVADVLAESVNRPLDIVARYGGEEYVMVLYDPSASFLDSFTRELCKKVVDLNIEHKASEQASQCVSLSIGAAMAESTGTITAEQLIRQADDALYEAKTLGRNRAVVYRAEWGKQTTAHLAATLL